MRKRLIALGLLSLTGCPNKAEKADAPAAENKNPYKNVMPKKVKADVEAAQKREEDRDDKIVEKAK